MDKVYRYSENEVNKILVHLDYISRNANRIRSNLEKFTMGYQEAINFKSALDDLFVEIKRIQVIISCD